MLHTGQAAFDAALDIVNIGKFNLGFASIGICVHMLYEAVTHAHNRTYFEMATRDIRSLPKLEGTVHVNMAQVLKFLATSCSTPCRTTPCRMSSCCERRQRGCASCC